MNELDNVVRDLISRMSFVRKTGIEALHLFIDLHGTDLGDGNKALDVDQLKMMLHGAMIREIMTDSENDIVCKLSDGGRVSSVELSSEYIIQLLANLGRL